MSIFGHAPKAPPPPPPPPTVPIQASNAVSEAGAQERAAAAAAAGGLGFDGTLKTSSQGASGTSSMKPTLGDK